MKLLLRIILLPVTIIVWFLLAYYTPYFALISTGKLIGLSWIALIFFGTLFFGFIYIIVLGLPNLIRIGISILLQKMHYVLILHGVAGIIGTITIILYFIQNPPMMSDGVTEVIFIRGMWEYAPLKTIVIMIEMIPIVLLMLYNSTIMPFVFINEISKERGKSKDEIIEVVEPVLKEEHGVVSDGFSLLEINRTHKTPFVLFKPEGELIIKGSSFHENPLFFEEIFDWISIYVNHPAQSTTFKIELEYYNDLNSKFLLRIIKDLNNHCSNFTVEWYYEEGDEDMLELGEILAQSSQCRFEFFEITY